jgi:hypothetical protein
VKQDSGNRLSDRTGQVWAYMGRPYLFLVRGDGPQGSTAPYNDWLIMDLGSGKAQSTRLYRENPMEAMVDRWERLA